MEPFTVQCSHCQARLKIKDEKYVGKRVKCPRCKQPFVVQAPASDPTASESPLARMLEEEATEQQAHVETMPSTLGPTLPRSGGVRGAGRTGPQSQQDSSAWKKPALIAGSIAAVVVIVAVLLLKGGSDEPPALNLAYLPQDAELIVAVRVADLWNAPLVQKLFADAGPDGQQAIDEMQKAIGLTPADIESVVFATSNLSDVVSAGMTGASGFGPMGGPTELGQGPPAPGVAVIRTRQPYDQQKLLAEAAERKEAEHDGKAYLRVTLAGDPQPVSVYFADDHTIVVGTDEELKAAISRGDRSPPLPAELKVISPQYHLALALRPSAEMREQVTSGGLMPGAEDTGPPDETADPVSKLLEDNVTGLGLSLQVTDALTAQVVLPCETAQGAEQLSTALQGQLEQARTAFADTKDSMPAALFQALEQALTSAKSGQREDVVELTGTLPASFFEPDTLASIPMLLMPLIMGGMMEGMTVDGEPVDFEFTPMPSGQPGIPGGPSDEPSNVPGFTVEEPDKSSPSVVTTLADGELQKKLTLSNKEPSGVFAPRRPEGPPLFATLELTGKPIVEASEYGLFQITTAKDDKGKVLKLVTPVKTRFGKDLAQQFVELDHFFLEAEDTLKLQLMLERPSPQATQLALLEGSLKLKRRNSVLVDGVLQKVGTTLTHPELKAVGRITIRKPSKDDVDDAEKAIVVEVAGPEESIHELTLLNGNGDRINGGTFSFSFGPKTLHTLEATEKLTPDTKLRIILGGPARVVSIPFKFESSPLPESAEEKKNSVARRPSSPSTSSKETSRQPKQTPVASPTRGKPKPPAKVALTLDQQIVRAASANDVAKVKALLKSNPELVNTTKGSSYPSRSTPLGFAAYNGRKAVVEVLLANDADVNAANRYGQTPLHDAAGRGHQDIVALLLAKGADANVKDKRGKTPLQYATDKKHQDVVNLLRQHGARQ